MAREFFKNLPDTSTPLNAQTLNNILNEIEKSESFCEYQLSNDFAYTTGNYERLPFNREKTMSPYFTNENGVVTVNTKCLLLVNVGIQHNTGNTAYLPIYKNDIMMRNYYLNANSCLQTTYLIPCETNDRIDIRFYMDIDCNILNNDFSYLQITII